MLGICCALGYIFSKLQTNVLFCFFYNTDEMVQSPALGSPEPHKLGWGNIKTQEDSPKFCTHKILDLHSALKKEQVFIKYQLRQRNPNACESNLQRK